MTTSGGNEPSLIGLPLETFTPIAVGLLTEPVIPYFPSVVTGPTFVHIKTGNKTGKDFLNLSVTSKALHGKCFETATYISGASDVLLASGLRPLSATSTKEERYIWDKIRTHKVRHLVLAYESFSYTNDIDLLHYLAEHPSEDSIKTITLDGRICHLGGKGGGTIEELSEAAADLSLSRPEKPIRIQIYKYGHTTHPWVSNPYGGTRGAIGGTVRDATFWVPSDFEQAPAVSGKLSDGDTQRTLNCNIAGVHPCSQYRGFFNLYEAVGDFCRRQFEGMSEATADNPSAHCTTIVNLYADSRDRPARSPGSIRRVIDSNEWLWGSESKYDREIEKEIQKIRRKQQAASDRSGASKPPAAERCTLKVNYGVCDSLPYTVVTE